MLCFWCGFMTSAGADDAIPHEVHSGASPRADDFECRYEPEPVSGADAVLASHATERGKGPAVPFDDQCFISAQAAIAQWKEKTRLVIDVRPAEQWDRVRVPHSLNVRPDEIRTKHFLMNRAITLLDRGENLDAMMSLCARLRDSGFSDVKLVVGGLAEWGRSGPVLPSSRELADVEILSARDFMLARPGNEWVVAAIGFDPVQYEVFSDMHWVAHEGEGEKLIDVIGSKARELQAGENAAVLFISKSGAYERDIPGLKDLRRKSRVYFLEGGLSELQRYAESRRRMIARVDREPKLVKRCGR